MSPASGLRRRCRLTADYFAGSALGLDFCLGRGTERTGDYRELFGQFTVAENLDAVGSAVGQADRTHRQLVHPRAVVKLVQVSDVHAVVFRREARVVETALGHAADE